MGAFEAQPFSLSVTGGSGQTAQVEHEFASSLAVTVTGTGTDPVAGGKVTFSAPTSGASATFTGNPATIASDGSASVTATANGTTGSYAVSASAAGAQASVAFSLQNLRGPAVLYVVPGGVTAGSCFAWASACELSYALTQAQSGDQIWVAAGTYLPTTTTNRTFSFHLKNGVAVYGGFAGDETSIDQRDPYPATNATVLSGDIGIADDASDNSYHVVDGSSTNTSAVLDGFTVSGGNANGGAVHSNGGGMYNTNANPTVRNVTFTANTASNEGGGMSNSASSPTLTGVTFYANVSSQYGGGLDNESGSSPALTNVTFSNNSASYGGGMLNNNSSNPTLTNVTFYGNTGAGAAMANFRSSPTLTNATIAYNSGTWGAVDYNCSSNVTIRNSILWGNVGNYWVYTGACGGGVTTISYSDIQISWAGTGIINDNPLLAPLDYYGGAAKSMALLPGSPAIDAANIDYCPATDQRGVARPQGDGCDMGAFEAQPFSLSVTGGDNQTGLWNTAFADPLAVAVTGTGTDPVAGGKVTFSGPTSGASATFTGNPATIASDGTVSVTATANATAGGYMVSAGAAGATGVDFNLENGRGPSVLYVVPAGATSGYCLTWATACELRYALTQTQSGDQVWVAGGTYLPTASSTRTIAFPLKNNVAIYGGFAGTETTLGERNVATNVTVLSGDIGTPNVAGDNVYHVVTGGGLDATAILDGVTISGGYASGSWPTDDYNGAGMYVNGSVTLRNVTITGNAASYEGGGMYLSGGSPTLTNVTFSANSAAYGGGMWE